MMRKLLGVSIVVLGLGLAVLAADHFGAWDWLKAKNEQAADVMAAQMPVVAPDKVAPAE